MTLAIRQSLWHESETMAIDPTQTTVLRARYNAAVQRRIRTMQRNIRLAVRNRDMLRLDAPFPNQDIPFAIELFMRFYADQVNQRVLEVEQADGTPILPRGTQWQDVFVEDGYVRGVTRANRQLELFVNPFAPDPSSPVHVLRLQELFIRNFEALEKITADTAPILRDTLTQGMIEGVGAEEMARRIDNRIDSVTRVRARVMARTEIIHAHAEGTLNEYERNAVGVVIPHVEFTHAGDIRVCVRCLALASTDRFSMGPGIFPVQESHGIIPVHPQCRCTWLPAGFVGSREDVGARMQRAARDRQRIEVLRTSRSARRAQREASSPPRRRRQRVSRA